MEKGIHFENMIPGELIYLNLPFHPGNKIDRNPPGPPSNVRHQPAVNMGYPGVEVAWTPGTDDHWVSGYEVLRDGAVIARASKGMYCFDHSAGADPSAPYAVRTVDGAGLRARAAGSTGPRGKRAEVLDDAALAIQYAGEWKREANLQPAHAGTISHSTEKGASFTLPFHGAKIIWFAKLGAGNGRAQVEIDGQPDATVDTFSADDIWGVGVYTKQLGGAGAHTIRVTALDEKPIYVDGIRVE